MGDNFSHVYYADGNNEYMILYGVGITPTRHKLPLSSQNIPVEMAIYTDGQGDTLPRDVTYFEHMCYHKNRMFGSLGNMLYISDLQNPMNWIKAYSTGEMRIPNCNQITGLVSFDDKLIVFSEKNMYLLYGNTPDSRETDILFSGVSLDNDIGCYDQNTVKVHNSLLYWLYGRGVYEYDGATIKNIAKPTGNNGVNGGIQEFINGITVNEAKRVSVAASEDKIYFWFSTFHIRNSIDIVVNPQIDIIVGSPLTETIETNEDVTKPCFLIFDQRLRKWTRELQCDIEGELNYVNICDSYADLNYSNTPTPIYALSKNGMIYELTGGKRVGDEYIKVYGIDEYVGVEGQTEIEEIPFYIKTKEFKNGVLSNKKSLSQLWFNYDLDGTVNLKIITDTGDILLKENVFPKGTNKTECILIPNEFQNVNSYTFEIYGTGDFTLYAMERKDRIHLR